MEQLKKLLDFHSSKNFLYKTPKIRRDIFKIFNIIYYKKCFLFLQIIFNYFFYNFFKYL